MLVEVADDRAEYSESSKEAEAEASIGLKLSPSPSLARPCAPVVDRPLSSVKLEQPESSTPRPESTASSPSSSPPQKTTASSSSAPLPIVTASPAQPLRSWRLTSSGLVAVSAETMGAFLDKPRTAKETTAGAGKGLRYASSTMQGWRIDMEDAHVVKLSMGEEEPLREWSFFAVFDGHAGSVAAEDAAEKILHTLLETPHFGQVTAELATNGGVLCDDTRKILEQGIKAGFLALDDKIRDTIENSVNKDRSGTTAVCAIVTPSHVVIANLGDSRAVVSKKGDQSFGTEDHKPTVDRERERIVNAGGSVMIQRINGSLAVSRALGDFEYKATAGLAPARQQVSAEPDVYFIDRERAKDEFLVLACDGIYDVMTNDELCEFVESRIEVHGEDLQAVCNDVLDACLQKGSRDNMTILLVCFAAAPQLNPEKAAEDAARKEVLSAAISAIVDDELEREMISKLEDISPDVIVRNLVNRAGELIPEGPARLLTRSLVESVIAERERLHAEKEGGKRATSPSGKSSVSSGSGRASPQEETAPSPAENGSIPAAGI